MMIVGTMMMRIKKCGVVEQEAIFLFFFAITTDFLIDAAS